MSQRNSSPGKLARARRIEAAQLRQATRQNIPRLDVPGSSTRREAEDRALNEEISSRTCTSGTVLDSDSLSSGSESDSGSGSLVSAGAEDFVSPNRGATLFESLPRHTQTEQGALAPRGRELGARRQEDASAPPKPPQVASSSEDGDHSKQQAQLSPTASPFVPADRRASGEIPALPQGLLGPVLASSMKVSAEVASVLSGDNPQGQSKPAENVPEVFTSASSAQKETSEVTALQSFLPCLFVFEVQAEMLRCAGETQRTGERRR
jgi:hypothetical protein